MHVDDQQLFPWIAIDYVAVRQASFVARMMEGEDVIRGTCSVCPKQHHLSCTVPSLVPGMSRL